MAEAGKGIKMQRDVVRDNSIFREKVKAEKRHAVLNENFDFLSLPLCMRKCVCITNEQYYNDLPITMY